MEFLIEKINKEISRAENDRKFLPKDTKFMSGMIHGLKVARNMINEASQQSVEAEDLCCGEPYIVWEYGVEKCINCGTRKPLN